MKEEIENELYRYKTLYEILLEENKLLKETNIQLQNIVNENSNTQGEQKKSIIYRGLRKVYRLIKR